jgi:DNA-binding response OmpR family regulator
MDRRKLIIVDDFQYHLVSAKERLKDYCDVYPALSAEIMFNILEKVLPDAILLDIQMPDSDGFETIRMLKGDDRFSGIPVIFLSMINDRESIIKGLGLGAADFICKPFETPELIACIEGQCNPEARADQKPVILALDENPDALASLENILGEGYEVHTLKKQGMIKNFVTNVTPDLFLLEYVAPLIKIKRFDLVSNIRSLPGHENTPVILMTAKLPAGIDPAHEGVDYIAKPVNEAELREKVASGLANFMVWRRLRSL